MKNYAELDLALALTDIHDPEEDNILCGIAIPSKFRSAFIRDVEQLAVTKYGGATFEELMEKDDDDASLDAAIHTNLEEKRLREEGPIEADFEVVKDKNLLS
ncbi:MAG: hypothetical protein PUA57_06175 [Eggerthellales bacterium]|nr:hypothetical protein [Eggerthellales bacterium]